MNLLYCGDSGVCQGIALSARSVCRYAEAPVSVFILTAGVGGRQPITAGFGTALERTLCSSGLPHCVRVINISALFTAQPPIANMQTRFTPCCMLRLYGDLVPEIPDRVLYLDSDVLCRSSLMPLFCTDMEGKEIAGVPDRYGKWFFGNPLRHSYLNSGVLLLDMKQIRQSGLFARCRAMCRDKKMFMPDQTALNKLAKKKRLPRCYNEQSAIRPATICKHFTTFFRFFPYFHTVTVKPWDTQRLHKELNIYEFDYLFEETTQ